MESNFGTLKKIQGFVRVKYLDLAKADMQFHLPALAHNLKKDANLVFLWE